MNDLVQLTADLIDQPSVSFHEKEFVEWLEGELKSLSHLEVVRVGDNLIARTSFGRSQRVILAGHTDTVLPTLGNEVSKVEGDVVWGCGAADMKGGLAVFLELARNLSNCAKDYTLVFFAREEVDNRYSGLNEIISTAPDLIQGDCAIVGEPTVGIIEAGCQGTLRIELTISGVRAHTARPWMGRNAIHRLAPFLFELEAFKVRTPTIDGCTFCESIQAVHIEGGVAGNVVPEKAVVRIHYRYAPDRSPAQAEEMIRGLLEPYLEPADVFEIVDGSPACLPQLNHPIFESLVALPEMEVKAKLGWTDVARFSGLGIPAINLGPGDPLYSHSADEQCDRESLERVYRVVEQVLTS